MMLLLIFNPVLLNIVCVGSALAAILTFKKVEALVVFRPDTVHALPCDWLLNDAH